MSRRSAFLLLLVILIVTFIPFLGLDLFSTKGEPREAVVAVSMLKSGNWILPVTFGSEIPYKPPMLAWCIAALGWLNGGHVTEFLSRLPSALAMIALCLAGFRFYSRRTSVRLALAMALITAGSFEMFRTATICRVDMLLTGFMVTAIYALYRQRERHPHSWAPSIAGALLMTGAVLTKGPVGMLLPCLVVWVLRLVKGNGFLRASVSVGLSGLMALIVPALWYVAAYNQGGEEFLRLAMEENFGRFSGTMSYESHENPWWYNLLTLSYGLAPYTLLLLFSLPALALCLRKNRRESNDNQSDTLSRSIGRRARALWSRFRAMDAPTLLAVLGLTLIFLFYCFPKSKRSVYLLPCYPFAAYLIAVYIGWLLRRSKRVVETYCSFIASLLAIASAALLLIGEGIYPASLETMGDGVLENLRILADSSVKPFLWSVVTLVSAIIVMRKLWQKKTVAALTWAMVLIPMVYCMVQAAVLPAVMNPKSDKVEAQALQQLVPGDEPIYSFRPQLMDRYYVANFYLGDRLKVFDHDWPTDGLLITGEYDFAELKARLPHPYEFEEITRLTRPNHETGQRTLLMRFRTPGQ